MDNSPNHLRKHIKYSTTTVCALTFFVCLSLTSSPSLSSTFSVLVCVLFFSIYDFGSVVSKWKREKNIQKMLKMLWFFYRIEMLNLNNFRKNLKPLKFEWMNICSVLPILGRLFYTRICSNSIFSNLSKWQMFNLNQLLRTIRYFNTCVYSHLPFVSFYKVLLLTTSPIKSISYWTHSINVGHFILESTGCTVRKEKNKQQNKLDELFIQSSLSYISFILYGYGKILYCMLQ